jgi:monofunctional biosynthetic peptidoglycan transglycosylase
MTKKRAGKRRNGIGKWMMRLLAIVLSVTILPVLALRWLSPPTTSFIVQAQLGTLGKHAQCNKVNYQWVPIKRIARLASLAVIASEDQLFSQHWGFDFNAIGQVLEGGEKRGASTISQQVAKNLFLWPGRSWVRKGFETYLTAWIELVWNKRRIMEVYLNTAQFGPCTFGVGAAAKQFFGKQASSLSLNESALLATVLPNPYRMNPGRPSEYMLERALWIESQVVQLGGTAYLEGW